MHIAVEQLKTRRMAYEEQFTGVGIRPVRIAGALADGCDGTSSGKRSCARWRRASDAPRPDQSRAAIEEYQVQLERKQYLGAQHADVNEALTTLEQAIRRDRPRDRARVSQETFDRVDAG